MQTRCTVGAIAGVLLAVAGQAPAQAPVTDPRQLEARLARLEQSMSSSSVRQMHESLQGLSRELRELRGEIELQRHTMEQLKQRQRELYLDVDRRMQALESGTAAAAPDAGAAAAAAAAAEAGTPAPPGPGPGPGQAMAGAAPAAPPSADTAAGADALPAPAADAQVVDLAAEQQAYRDAFELLKGGQFKQASASLTQFLADYPSGRFTDNAWYWLGESYYVSREFGPALKAFERLLVDFPDSPKRSHAMLKIGFIHDEEGRKDQAKQVLTELIQAHPQSTAAGLAEKRLKRLQ
jgi:tol-pal system protein YbgF